MAAMKKTVPSAPPFSSSVTKEAASIFRSGATGNRTAPISLMSMNATVRDELQTLHSIFLLSLNPNGGAVSELESPNRHGKKDLL